MTKFYKTTFTIEVLSEEPLPDCMSVRQIDWAISDGDCVGRFADTSVKDLTSREVASELYEFGSEPSFFNLDDDGLIIDA